MKRFTVSVSDSVKAVDSQSAVAKFLESGDSIREIVALAGLHTDAELERARAGGRQEVIERIEKLSSPMNTNMYGISLSKAQWQALKGKEGNE